MEERNQKIIKAFCSTNSRATKPIPLSEFYKDSLSNKLCLRNNKPKFKIARQEPKTRL
jgi:hypothetical protein